MKPKSIIIMAILSAALQPAPSPGFISTETVADTLNLRELYGAVSRAHPVSSKERLIERKEDLSGRNLTFNWFPSFDLEGRAFYQSEVISIEPEFPPGFPAGGIEFPSPAKDQYSVELKVSQMIFDGFVTSARREVLEREIDIELKEMESEIYSIKRAINNYYFSILVLRTEIDIARTVTDDLNKQRGRLVSALKHGTAPASSLHEIESRIVQSEQKSLSIKAELSSVYSALAELTGIAIDTSSVLDMPEYSFWPEETEGDLGKRPDVEIFDLMMKRTTAAEKLTLRKKFPKIYGFASLGYGRPGLNMMSDEYDSYYTAGLTLSWDIFDWGNNRREREIQKINREILDRGRESMLRNIRGELQRAARMIEKYTAMLEKDRRILQLRESIAADKRSRFENGDITADDYISEINRLEQARLNMEKDRIELQKARVDYLMIKGEL